jgi:hypothetical protein
MKLRLVAASVFFVFAFFLLASAFAWDERWEIKQKSGFSNYGNGSKDIEMKKKYDYDPANKFRGTIDSDGSVRMRDYKGNTLRGTIDEDGRGRLRDQDGNYYRVKPKW